MTYAQRLKKATAKAFRANPKLGWRDAKERAKNYLNNICSVYPCTKALMREFKRWQKQQANKETA